MGSGHGPRLYHPGSRRSVLHRMRPERKLVCLLVFVLLVVATPRTWFAAFGLELLVVLALARLATVPLPHLIRRMVVELPFVVFALLVPFVATGPRVEVLGIAVSRPGLLAAWALLAKGTLGVLASLLFASTTQPRDVLLALQRLRVPRQLVEITAFMVRYLDVVGGDLRRMRIARESRGFHGRGPAQWPVLAKASGALFIRSYERGERVHLAMLSRGYTGQMPTLDDSESSRRPPSQRRPG